MRHFPPPTMLRCASALALLVALLASSALADTLFTFNKDTDW
jgi:hypothetical protein